MSEAGIKTSQRVSRSCVECSRRKIRCDKKSPCAPCVRRNAGNSCRRPIVRVRGQLTVYADSDAASAEDVQLEDLLRERGALRAQIAELETALALSKPCAHSRTSESTDYSAPSASLEDLIPAFEQFDIGITTNAAREGGEKDLIDRLYEPAADPIYLLLPSKDASIQLVTFSLQTLGWLHCAVDADVFFGEHEEFWQSTQLGAGIDRARRPWLVVYLAVLAVGILYFNPDEIPDVNQLPQLGMPLDNPVSIAVHTSRLWYEAALKELERYGFAGLPSLPVVQALSVLTLCHSNFGEHQREWLITGFATNMARCLDMHKLGNEVNISKDLCKRPEWSSPSQREMGRRLWWACVIRDWLGSWSRPPSISPASFCCHVSTLTSQDDYILPRTPMADSPASFESGNLATPSPAHYHSIMCRVSYIVYIYIKANTHQTNLKFIKAIEEVQTVRRDLPLHLSPNFPANEDDRIWELEYPWIPFQRYQIHYVIDFLLLTIARVLSPENPDDDPNFRQLALQSANNILNYYAKPVPRVYRLVWVISASTVAAAIYVSLDMLANPHDYRGDAKLRIINLLRMAFTELRKHSAVAVHAAKGSAVLEGLLPVLERHDTELPGTSRTIHELLQQLPMADHSNTNDLSNSAPPMDGFAHHGNYENIDMFDGIGSTLNATYGFDDWDEVFAQM
ncbi:hypothetical protein J4E86_010110 [Alternaria arbusti]|uniref:uncharacterized protein n=1 Tax=Alternaria arbusti TaxID=232088 RepID=UPI002220FCE2|nr:uncharacterized protein J4E86_010110 [Alternaria arbusti]KAI4942308.1 hypothetical protein J4E86_010110 [Alternaria arbusti]